MPLSIVIPVDLLSLLEDLLLSDIDNFILKARKCQSRSLAFYDETVIGFIIHIADAKQTERHPESAFLTVSSKQEEDHYNSISEEEEHDSNGSNGTHPMSTDVYSTLIKSPELRGSCEMDDSKVLVTVWKFEAQIRYHKARLGGPVIFSASLANPHLHIVAEDNLKSDSSLPIGDSPILSENLFEGLNFCLSGTSLNAKYEFSRNFADTIRESSKSDVCLETEFVPRTEIINPEEIATLTLATSLPLILRLKSTKPGGRNDILLTTLSIEASEELITFTENDGHEQYFFNILGLESSFKAGKIDELSALRFPCRCSISDVINITYKLVNNDYLDSQMKNATDFAAAISKPLNILLTMQVQKLDEITREYQNVSNVVSSNWTPILDFGLVAPPISNSLKPSANLSHFQLQSQFQPLAKASNGNLTRKSVMINNAMNANKSKASFAGLRANGPGRTHLTTSITPSLSKPSIVSKKAHKSMIALPTSSSAVTVNLTSNNNSTLAGLKLTFQGCLSVELGKIINWKVQAINNSNKALNLSLIVKNPINFHPNYLQANSSGQMSTASSSNMLSGIEDTMKDNVLVYSKLQLHYQYNLLKLETGGVIVLTNDIRLGPIEPNSVFESEFEIIGISKGIFNLNGLKIFDFTSGDGIDFGKLVEVFVM